MSDEIIQETFFPSLIRKKIDALKRGYQFAYYTTASTASEIISKQQLWLRSTGVMNDHSEVELGARGVFKTFKSEVGRAFYEAIESCHAGAAGELETKLDNLLPIILGDTFISCFSEHDASDDKFGRLSMWRAYGGDAGVAIIFKQAPFLSDIDVGAYVYPVTYGSEESVSGELREISENIKKYSSQLSNLPRETFTHWLFESMRACSIATKHKAFEEEREWRLVACPSLQQISFPYLKQEICNIGNVAQLVQQLNIGEAAKNGISALEPDHLIDKVLIGPTQYPQIVFRTMVEQLRKVGVINPESKVHNTRIPLRHNQR